MRKQAIVSQEMDLASRVAKLFRGFGDRSRLSILLAIETEAKTVNEIVEATGLTQPNVSNHLSCLRECGMVVATPNGKFNIYELTDPVVGQMLSCARQLADKTASELDRCKNY
jgi:ArsR family transcriptional regulator, cadmium/lead-responsive transcriptional repressor